MHLATASPATCRTCPRPSSPRSGRRRSARCGPPARLTSASTACSIASVRSHRACWSLPTATSTAARSTPSSRASGRSSQRFPRWSGRSSFRTSTLRRRWTTCHSAVEWETFLGRQDPEDSSFVPLPFDHPLYILYSSGTTGVPKCIVHGAGGTLIQHLKEHQLHCDMRAGRPRLLLHDLRLDDVELARHGARVGGHAGAVRRLAVPSRRQCPVRLRRRSGHDAVRHVGQVHRRGREGRTCTDRTRTGSIRVRTITSTGSPLAPESFDFVYEHIKRDVHLASISGGTDIVSCFVLRQPDRRRVARRDPGPRARHEGRSLRRARAAGASGRKGSSCARCRSPRCRSGSGTIPDGAKYRAAYFERFPGVWHHGDYVELTATRRRSSSTAAPTPCSTPAASASARRRSTARSNSSRKSSRAWSSASSGTATSGSCCSCDCATDLSLTPELEAPDPAPHPRERDAAARPGAHRPGRRDSAHQERQDRRAGGARRRPRARGARTSKRSRIPRRSSSFATAWSCSRDRP